MRKKKCSFLIGNGFDLALGFHTSYECFYNSTHFKNLVGENGIADYLKSQNEKNKSWCDVEMGLWKYEKEIEKQYGCDNSQINDRFRADHKQLTVALQNHIADCSSGRVSPKFVQLIEDWNLLYDIRFVCCFNYTTNVVLFKLLQDYYKLYNIHGSIPPQSHIETPCVVLGIDPSMEVCPQHQFLYKNNQKRDSQQGQLLFTTPSKELLTAHKIVKKEWKSLYEDVEEVIVFGCSFSKSDEQYFKYLLEHRGKKQLIIYHYGAKDRADIEDRICEMFPNESFDNITFRDSTKYSSI